MESLSTIIGTRTVGVVGVGKWGKHLVQTLAPHTPHPILQSDPVRAAAEPDFPHTPLGEITERADIIVLSAPLDVIRGIILEMRSRLRPNHVIIDIASSKRDFRDLLQEIDQAGEAKTGSIHPMANPPPGLPSLRGQNGIICQFSERSKEAEQIAEALFVDQEMIIHRMRTEEHDRMMDLVQGLPHFLQLGACDAMGKSLPGSLTIRDLEKFGSPNFHIFDMAVGRAATLDAELQANLITSIASSEEGLHDLKRVIASLQRIMEMAKRERSQPKGKRKLPVFIEQARAKLDPDRTWRKHMEELTNTIIVRLANIRKKSLHLTAQHDHIGLLEKICAILRRHGIDLNAIDSLPSKLFPEGMEFELGHKDKASVNLSKLMGDLAAIDVLLKEAEPQT